MQERNVHTTARNEARAFEQALPLSQRKELGQFFTGMPLGRVLAHLAIHVDTGRVLDPMAGTGDLLDAVHEAATICGAKLDRLDAIEVDEAAAAICNDRLTRVCTPGNLVPHVISGDAFDPDTYNAVPETGYDLVITNPPYVRYQSLNGRAGKTREGLLNIARQRLSAVSQEVWTVLAGGYSGLADLSIPAWLLSGLLVKPGGRLALVVPATWRSRAYADVIRYLLLRCFALEAIVEDTQPGWFSDALVRTHLIVAQRLADSNIAVPLSARMNWPLASWMQIAPEASDSSSLVGESFDVDEPEAAFASWCWAKERKDIIGVSARGFSLESEWGLLRQQARSRGWMEVLEQEVPELPLFPISCSLGVPVPDSLNDLLPANFSHDNLITLEDAGIRTGQGLRTGCNRFFYVHLVAAPDQGFATVKTDPALGSRVLVVPVDALMPVIHRQSELGAWISGTMPHTRVLDLRKWVLSEDYETVCAAKEVYQRTGNKFPRVMPEVLASYVRDAGAKPLGGKKDSKPVSDFSAVRTNVRSARENAQPRFWYMLPDFMPRHLPQAFVPRIIHGAPQVYSNSEPPILIDANFSTFWPQQHKWTPVSLTAFLNSIWCRTVMESVGTPLGGGALKLEAIHIRRMPVPKLSDASIKQLEVATCCFEGKLRGQMIDRVVLGALLDKKNTVSGIDAFAHSLSTRLAALGAARKRGTA